MGQVAHPLCAALAVDGGGDDALYRLAAFGRLPGYLRRSQAVDRLDQLDLVAHDGLGVTGTNRFDIGGVDEPDREVGITEPHRHRCRLDQPDQRREIGAGLGGFGAQRNERALAFGEVEHPHQRRAARRNLRIGQRALQGDAALRPFQRQRYAERRAGFLRAHDRFGQFGKLAGGKAGVALARQFGEEAGQRLETQPAGQPVRPFQPPVGAHQQRDRRALVDHAGQPPRRLAAAVRAACPAAGGNHHPRRPARPQREQQSDDGQGGGRKFHRRLRYAATARDATGARPSCTTGQTKKAAPPDTGDAAFAFVRSAISSGNDRV